MVNIRKNSDLEKTRESREKENRGAEAAAREASMRNLGAAEPHDFSGSKSFDATAHSTGIRVNFFVSGLTTRSR